MEHLTNNAAEAGNRRLRQRCKTVHPGIYRFMMLLKSEIEHALLKIEQAKAGHALPDHRKDVKSAMEIRLRLI